MLKPQALKSLKGSVRAVVLAGKEPAGLKMGSLRDWLEVAEIRKVRECVYLNMLTASCSLTGRNQN
jgi:hypothetical protein